MPRFVSTIVSGFSMGREAEQCSAGVGKGSARMVMVAPTICEVFQLHVPIVQGGIVKGPD